MSYVLSKKLSLKFFVNNYIELKKSTAPIFKSGHLLTCVFTALLCTIPSVTFAANENKVPWTLDNQKNQNIKLLMPAFSGSFENRSLVLIFSPVKYTKQKVEFSVGVTAACSRSLQLAKSYQVTTYPAAENGGRFKLALPKHLARCFKIDPKGEISVALTFRSQPTEELVSLRGSAFIE
ncbi:MAG TPA: hypothetical protein VIZ65_17380 [Cellvibrionaceae bacterium]